MSNKPIMFSVCGFGIADYREPPPLPPMKERQLRQAMKQIKRELNRRPKWNRPKT